MSTVLVLAVGALCGGFVNGLAGFGTGLTTLGLWLHVVSPPVAAALVVVCSVVGQVQSLFLVRRAVAWSRAWPFLVGGVLGLPIGVAALHVVDPKVLKVLLGLLLVGYTGLTLAVRRFPTVSAGGRAADGVVGFGGGALGGVAGLSGALPTIWCSLRGWNADTHRGVYQPFNLAILGIVLCTYTAQGTLTAQVWRYLLVCLPGTIVGAFLGVRVYGRVDDRQFRALVLWLLLASGIVLIASNLQ